MSSTQNFAGGEEDAGRAREDRGGATLEDLGRAEREYVKGRLRGELGREPSEEEVSEWLRQHTEGH